MCADCQDPFKIKKEFQDRSEKVNTKIDENGTDKQDLLQNEPQLCKACSISCIVQLLCCNDAGFHKEIE